jgi:hypothetical protein
MLVSGRRMVLSQLRELVKPARRTTPPWLQKQQLGSLITCRSRNLGETCDAGDLAGDKAVGDDCPFGEEYTYGVAGYCVDVEEVSGEAA